MAYIPPGTYTTGMKPPLPYGVVDTTVMEVVEAPERFCSQAIADTPGASACWVQTDLHDPVVGLHQVSTQGFCMDVHPFPGQDSPYPPDGLSTWDASLFDEMLSSGRFGPRRLCSFSEYELAVAGPLSNQRFIYGDQPNPSLCPDDEQTPIGSFQGCMNQETGLHEYGAVLAQWVHLDEQLVDWACRDPETCKASGGARLDDRSGSGAFSMPYIVAGGTHRIQTRQAPYTPHTFHDHGQVTGAEGCDDWGWDDGVAVCAEPDPRYRLCASQPGDDSCRALRRQELLWQKLLSRCKNHRMTECLSWGVGLVRGKRFDACPGSPGELGPGQGR